MTLKNEVPDEKTKEPKKKNYCNKDGECTVQRYPDECNCEYYAQAEMRGGCIMCLWTGDCMSPFA
jgi:hypothetical protein